MKEGKSEWVGVGEVGEMGAEEFHPALYFPKIANSIRYFLLLSILNK